MPTAQASHILVDTKEKCEKLKQKLLMVKILRILPKNTRAVPQANRVGI